MGHGARLPWGGGGAVTAWGGTRVGAGVVQRPGEGSAAMEEGSPFLLHPAPPVCTPQSPCTPRTPTTLHPHPPPSPPPPLTGSAPPAGESGSAGLAGSAHAPPPPDAGAQARRGRGATGHAHLRQRGGAAGAGTPRPGGLTRARAVRPTQGSTRRQTRVHTHARHARPRAQPQADLQARPRQARTHAQTHVQAGARTHTRGADTRRHKHTQADPGYYSRLLAGRHTRVQAHALTGGAGDGQPAGSSAGVGALTRVWTCSHGPRHACARFHPLAGCSGLKNLQILMAISEALARR